MREIFQILIDNLIDKLLINVEFVSFLQPSYIIFSDTQFSKISVENKRLADIFR